MAYVIVASKLVLDISKGQRSVVYSSSIFDGSRSSIDRLHTASRNITNGSKDPPYLIARELSRVIELPCINCSIESFFLFFSFYQSDRSRYPALKCRIE